MPENAALLSDIIWRVGPLFVGPNTCGMFECFKQGRSDGGYIGIYTPQISLPYIFYVVVLSP